MYFVCSDNSSLCTYGLYSTFYTMNCFKKLLVVCTFVSFVKSKLYV